MPGPQPLLCTFPKDFLQEAQREIRRRTIWVQQAQRYQLVLLLHSHPHISNTEAAEVVGLSERQVRRWRRRWANGDFTIEDREGRGRKTTFSPGRSRLGGRPRV